MMSCFYLNQKHQHRIHTPNSLVEKPRIHRKEDFYVVEDFYFEISSFAPACPSGCGRDAIFSAFTGLLEVNREVSRWPRVD